RRWRVLPSLEPHARIDDGVGHVDDEVDDYEHEGYEQDSGHGHRVIATRDGVEGQPTDTGPREDDLGHDGASHHGGELHAGNGDHGDGCVLERVLEYDGCLAKSFGVGGPDVVLAQYLEHARAHQSGYQPVGEPTKNQTGQHQVTPRARATGR